MTTETLVRKMGKELSILRNDVEGMKKALFASYSDPEGEYRPAFVKKMLERMASKGPVYRFTTKEEFLRHVRSKK
ncbi:MAG: hypothetical protein Q8R20_02150 [Nanoarchaeota archaeon]|nr:hypothetical protein [Nanoarchaeota archaeon]